MWFECQQPFVGEERCVTRQKRLPGRLLSNLLEINKPPSGVGGAGGVNRGFTPREDNFNTLTRRYGASLRRRGCGTD